MKTYQYAVKNADGIVDELPLQVNLDTAKLLVKGFAGSVLLRRSFSEWEEVGAE